MAKARERVRFVSFLLLLSLSGFVFGLASKGNLGVEVKNKQYRVPEVTSGIKTDGVLDEEVWKQAVVIGLDYEVNPGENIKPPVETEVLLAYSKTRLYIAFRSYDPDPSRIRVRISDHDDVWDQDWVGVVLDTFNDERRSFDFLCNPLGVQNEFIESTDSDGEWDTIWDSGGRINDLGYFVEISIPFSSLRFQRSEKDQIWGFDAVRSYPRSVRHHIGTFSRDRNNNCYLCQSIKLIGFKNAKPGKNIELDPTLSGHMGWERENDSGDFEKDQKLEAGITAHWGFTPNLTLSLTVNPDFSQVEADALQMDVNEPFALYFPEKRPFFTEGGDFFSSRMDTIYTRVLRAPSWGIKLSGKEGANSIGAYVVRDTYTNILFPGSEDSDSTSIAEDSTATVLRYRRDFGNKYTVGMLFTNRSGENYFNRVYGMDGDFRVTSKDRLNLQILGSSTSYADDVVEEFQQPMGKFNDKAIDFRYFHSARSLNWWGGYKDIGEDFRADLGFITQVGYRSYYGGAEHTWFAKPDKWWSSCSVEAYFIEKKRSDGQLLQRLAGGSFFWRGIKESYFVSQYVRVRELYDGVYFDQSRCYLHFDLNVTGRLSVWLNSWFGDRIDYSNTRLGNRFRFGSGFNYNIGLHIQLNFNHNFERLRVDSQRLYTANQSELRLVYQFNRRTFLRGILHYVDYRYNTAMYLAEQDPAYKHLFTQLLFSYKINPQTVLFLGYKDNYYAYDLEHGLPQSDRMFFLKIGYALVL
ncbi:MAG: carbohydrate binding family 9 domain-containing protein [bacterium]|nr:carbohydrate binding family 9 domain-containing protein [bacterium]